MLGLETSPVPMQTERTFQIVGLSRFCTGEAVAFPGSAPESARGIVC